jgi:urea transport system permease protein
MNLQERSTALPARRVNSGLDILLNVLGTMLRVLGIVLGALILLFVACWVLWHLYLMTATDWSAAISNSLSLSSILILSALGLAITFGVMRVINMAHGDMMMLGAYTALVVTEPKYLNHYLHEYLHFTIPPAFLIYVAIPTSFLVVGFIGYLMEVGLIRFLYGRPLDTLLATWGVGLIAQQLVNLSFGADLQSLPLPEHLRGGYALGGVTIPYYRLFIVGITALCLLGIYVLFYETTFGLKVRAVVQNRGMAGAIGISTRRVDSLSFALATGLAGVAGCILAHLYNTKYTMGNDYIVDAFMVVILGGMGQLAGAVGGGALYGTADSFVEKFLNDTTMAKALILFAVVVFLLWRPSGIFVTKERSYES